MGFNFMVVQISAYEYPRVPGLLVYSHNLFSPYVMDVALMVVVNVFCVVFVNSDARNVTLLLGEVVPLLECLIFIFIGMLSSEVVCIISPSVISFPFKLYVYLNASVP